MQYGKNAAKALLVLVGLLILFKALPAISSKICVEALADALKERLVKGTACNDSISTAASIRSWLPSLLESSCAIGPMNYVAGVTAQNISWHQHPGWHNGLMFEWLRALTRISPDLLPFNATAPDRLPTPDEIPTSDAMHEHTEETTAAIGSTDSSTASLENFLTAQAYRIGLRSLAFNHLPENACIDEGRPTGPLHPRTYLLTFYRRDALAQLHAAGLTTSTAPPEDWNTLRDLLSAHAVAVEQHLAGSLPRYGICLTTHTSCGRLGDVLTAIAASIVQTRGTQHGYVFDLSVPPPAAVPLVNSTGWRSAAKILHAILRYNAPDGDDAGCWGMAPSFLSGDCLLTLEWDAALPLAARAAALQGPGVLGVAPLPGSTEVIPKGVDNPVLCAANLCGVSAYHDLLYLGNTSGAENAQKAAAAGGAAARIAAMDVNASVLEVFAAAEVAAAMALVSGAGVQARINRAPYSAAYAATFEVNYDGFDRDTIPSIALMQQEMLRSLASYRSLRQNITDDLRRPLGYYVITTGDTQNCSGYRTTAWWAAMAAPDVQSIAAAIGLTDTETAAEYLRSLWHAIHHPNTAPDVQSPVPVNWFKYAASYAAAMLMLNATAVGSGGATASARTDSQGEGAGAVNATVDLLTQLYSNAIAAFGSLVIRGTYEQSISAREWEPPDEDNSGQPTHMLIAVPVSLLGFILLLAGGAVALLVVLRQRRRRHRDLLGRVLAPRVGPDTTLLITDIQNSTVLWEALPVAVMDTSLKLHHTTLRRVMGRYDGYESATEGDSFIVAFANPASAVAFAVAVQVDLMLQDWPHELLLQPDAAPMVVVPDLRSEVYSTLGLPNILQKHLMPSRRSLYAARQRALRSTWPSSVRTGPLSASMTGPAFCRQAPRCSTLLPIPSGRPSEEVHVQTLDLAQTSSPNEQATTDHGLRSAQSAGLILEIADDAPASSVALTSSRSDDLLSYSAASDDGCANVWQEALSAAFPTWVAPEQDDLLGVMDMCDNTRYNKLAVALPDGRQGLLSYRGLRVRMGLHTGLDDQQYVAFNRVGSTFKYYGPFAEVARLVSDSAPGGMVTMSSRTFTRLRNCVAKQNERTGARVAESALVVYGGHHELSETPPPTAAQQAMPYIVPGNSREPPEEVGLTTTTAGAGAPASGRMGLHGFSGNANRALARSWSDAAWPRNAKCKATVDGAKENRQVSTVTAAICPSPTIPMNNHSLFLAVHPALVSRLALSPPLRTRRVCQMGTLAAPVGHITVAFMKVLGASTLLADLPGPAGRALEQFQALACRLLGAAGGYMVEGGDGLVLAAFAAPSTAVEWALDCLAGLAQLIWEDALLEHEICAEELLPGLGVTGTPRPGPRPAALGAASRTLQHQHQQTSTVSIQTSTLLQRGLRVKVGLGMGPASHTLTEASGRLSYRGKLMNRAARVAGIAAAGQVLCTGAVWDACQRHVGFPDRVAGVGLGRMSLKGVSHPVEVVQCVKTAGETAMQGERKESGAK